MKASLKPIYIKDLISLSSPKLWEIYGYIDSIKTASPISGSLSAWTEGQALKVKGNLQTILDLICDRCLQTFKHNLKFDIEELICIKGNRPYMEIIQEDYFADYLDPNSTFNPERWIFEQFSLQMPLLNICGSDCTAPIDLNNQKYIFSKTTNNDSQEFGDPRWADLKKLL